MSEKTLYFKKLDSLRMIAFLIVFCGHSFYHSLDSIKELSFISPIFGAGDQGVRIFFVLSGFLITYLLLIENETNHKISIKNFYIRRTLRIWPLYYLILLVGIYILPNISSIFKFCGNPLMNLLFLNNFNIFETGNCYNPHILIAWSVAIEEQFYLIWPIIFNFGVKKKKLPLICIIGFITGYLYSVFINYNYFSSICNINYLLIGCYGGYLYKTYFKEINNSWIKSNYFLCLLIIFLCLLTIILSFLSKDFTEFIYIKEILYPIIYILIVLYCVASDSSSNRKGKIFSSLGKYNYGMYLYHPMIVLFFKIIFDKLKWDYLNNPILNFNLAILSLISTIIISIISYKYFEKIFLNFKQKFATVKTRV